MLDDGSFLEITKIKRNVQDFWRQNRDDYKIIGNDRKENVVNTGHELNFNLTFLGNKREVIKLVLRLVVGVF